MKNKPVINVTVTEEKHRLNQKQMMQKDWLLTNQFVIDETCPSVSDWKDRDEFGLHYLGQTNVEFGYCGALGFHSDIQGTFKRCGVTHNHFGDSCCCQGKVNGITDYNLPDNLSDLYTLKHVLRKPFLDNNRTYNNGMAMSSHTASTQG